LRVEQRQVVDDGQRAAAEQRLVADQHGELRLVQQVAEPTAARRGRLRADLAHERLDDGRVELGAGAALELRARRLDGAPLRVRTVGGHRAERVGHADDPCFERDLLAAQPGGVAHPGHDVPKSR
jgi:hypothetical protein